MMKDHKASIFIFIILTAFLSMIPCKPASMHSSDCCCHCLDNHQASSSLPDPPIDLDVQYEIIWCDEWRNVKSQSGKCHTPPIENCVPRLKNDRDHWVKIFHSPNWNVGDAYHGYGNTSFTDEEIQSVILYIEATQNGYDDPAVFSVRMIDWYPAPHWKDKYGQITTLGYSWYTLNLTAWDYGFFEDSESINQCELEYYAEGEPDKPDNATWWAGVKFTRSCLLVVSNLPQEWIDPTPPIEDYIPIGMGFGGLGCLMFLPLFLVMMIRKKKFWHWIPYAMMLFVIGIGCVTAWLWG